MASKGAAEAIKLLKLHMKWPERDTKAGHADEGECFFNWLKQALPQDPLVMRLQGPAELQKFLEVNREVIDKSYQTQADLRAENRIPRKLRVLVSQYDHTSRKFEESHRGETVHLGVSGLRVKMSSPISGKQILRLTVTPVGFPIRIYNLLADPRWQGAFDDKYHFGVRLREVEDFETWVREFEQRFLKSD